METIEALRQVFTYNPETGVLIRNSNGKEAGSMMKTGYLRVWANGKSYKAHRIIWMIYHGEVPDAIDHINGVRSENRIDNLRNVSGAQNSMNQRLRPDNRSGCAGVNWHAKANKWIAQIRNKGKYVYLGSFSELKDAISARRTAESSFGYHENHGQDRFRYERD